MKRFALLSALLALILAPAAFAESADEPSEVCDAAKVGFYLPEDTQTTVDTGTWIAVSQGDGLVVIMDKNDPAYSNKDLTEKNVKKAVAGEHVKGFSYLDTVSDNGLVYVYGKGSYRNKDGKTYEGFFGLLNNADVKGTTFFFAFMVPSLKDKAIYKRIVDMVANMVPME